MMCSQDAPPRGLAREALQRHRARPGGLDGGYRRLLAATPKMRWAVMVVFALVAGASALLLGSLKSSSRRSRTAAS